MSRPALARPIVAVASASPTRRSARWSARGPACRPARGRGVAVRITAAAGAAAALLLLTAACSAPLHRAEGRVVLSTASAVPAGTDVAIGTPAGLDPEPTMRPAETLDVAADPDALDVASRNGSITVVVDPAAEGLTIVADLQAGGATREQAESRLAAAEIEVVEASDGTVRIRPRMPDRWRNGDAASLHVTLTTPAAVRARSSNGALRVEGGSGPIDLGTSNGRITLVATDGPVEAETSNGRLVLIDTVGDITATSSNGRIEVTNHLGGLDLRTSNGPVRIDLHDEATGPVRVRSSNGSARLSVGPGFGGWLEADTSNGAVELTGSPRIAGDMRSGRSSLEVRLEGAEHRSRIDTSNGSVTIEVRGAGDGPGAAEREASAAG